MNRSEFTEEEWLEYDEHAAFYYSNIINSLILFSMTTVELDKLAAPTFNPLSELESEIDYAFLPVCFETVFRNNFILNCFKQPLLDFKAATDRISADIWDWQFIDTHTTWVGIRAQAYNLLKLLKIESRAYNDEFVKVIL